MNDSPKTTRSPILIVVTVVLTIPAFGAGLLVGNSSVQAAPDQTPPAMDEPLAPALDDPVAIELSACQQKLARRTADATPSTAEAAPEELKEATAEQQRQINALERQIKACRRSEMLNSAELCRSVRPHLDALLGLPKNDVLCVQRVRVADYIEDDFEKCAAFKKVPADLNTGTYTQEERKTILDAVDVAKTLDEEKLAELLNGVHQGCYGEPGTNSP